MGWYWRLVDWNRRYDIKFGWRSAWRCFATAFVITLLGWLTCMLFPLYCRAISGATFGLLLLAIGFVYERNSGPPLLLVTYVVIMVLSLLGKHNLVLIAITGVLPLVGFGISCLFNILRERWCHQSNEDSSA